MVMILKLTERYVYDLKKPELDHFERAEAIAEYLRDKRISIRSFAIGFNIPKSTVEDWLLWNRITRKEYNDFKGKGMTHLGIYKTLRDGKSVPKEEMMENTGLDFDVESCKRKLSKHLKGPFYYSSGTEYELKQLRDIINRVLLRIEREESR